MFWKENPHVHSAVCDECVKYAEWKFSSGYQAGNRDSAQLRLALAATKGLLASVNLKIELLEKVLAQLNIPVKL